MNLFDKYNQEYPSIQSGIIHGAIYGGVLGTISGLTAAKIVERYKKFRTTQELKRLQKEYESLPRIQKMFNKIKRIFIKTKKNIFGETSYLANLRRAKRFGLYGFGIGTILGAVGLGIYQTYKHRQNRIQ